MCKDADAEMPSGSSYLLIDAKEDAKDAEEDDKENRQSNCWVIFPNGPNEWGMVLHSHGQDNRKPQEDVEFS